MVGFRAGERHSYVINIPAVGIASFVLESEPDGLALVGGKVNGGFLPILRH